MKIERKSGLAVPESAYGVCLWEMPGGGFIADTDMNYLSLEGRMGDKAVENKMRKAAIYWAGPEASGGIPRWISGARKISDEEYEEQKGRLSEGKIPDPVEEARIILRQQGR